MILSYSQEAIKQSVQVLRAGGIIAYPTETVYGLGCDAMNIAAIERIQKLKGRDGQKPMLVLIHQKEDLPALAQNLQPGAKKLLDTFWPGPLTLLFEATPFVPKMLVGSNGTVGIRISPDPVCKAIMTQWKKPLISTSANLSGEPSAKSGEDVQLYFDNHVDIILDNGKRIMQNPSTIVDVTGTEPKVLREGTISIEIIYKIWENASE